MVPSIGAAYLGDFADVILNRRASVGWHICRLQREANGWSVKEEVVADVK